MMKIKLGQLKLSEDSLVKFSKQEIPVQMAFQISRVIQKVAPELQLLEQLRQQLVHKYGIEDKETGQITVPESKVGEFTEEIKPLLEAEVELDFQKIPLSKIPESVFISSVDLIALEPFIDLDS
jgi:hypothetical protein